MPTFSNADPGFKHELEIQAVRLRKFYSRAKTLAQLLYDPVGTENQYWATINAGTMKMTEDNTYTGVGVPSLTNVPDGGVAGNYYFRTDTPGTVSQRIYVCTVGTGNGTLGTWVATAA